MAATAKTEPAGRAARGKAPDDAEAAATVDGLEPALPMAPDGTVGATETGLYPPNEEVGVAAADDPRFCALPDKVVLAGPEPEAINAFIAV